VKYSFISTAWAWFLILYGIFNITKNRNKNNEASIFSSYIVGLEIILRMTGANVFWEYGKYAVILFLILGILVESAKSLKISFLMIIYIMFFIPSISLVPYYSFNHWRQLISFNLSGPFCLFISVLYFRNRIINKNDIIKIFRAMALPIITMSVIILIRLPSPEDIVFTSEANTHMSGGYGPNQVSSMFGVLITLIGISRINNYKLFKSEILDYLILGMCSVQAFLTFARGGVITSFLAIAIGWFVSLKQKTKTKTIKNFRMIILVGLIIILWNISTEITSGLMEERYRSTFVINELGQIGGSSRIDIMLTDIDIFFDNYVIGVGPGMAKHLRDQYFYGKAVAAHSEVTRILAEHGIIGLLGLFALGVFIFKEYFRRRDQNQVIYVCFVVIAVLTMLHSAMRLAMPGFIFGLSFIYISKPIFNNVNNGHLYRE